MYYKKQGSEPPIIKAGCVYEESYFSDGCLFLKYAEKNIPSGELTEIMQEEYEVNKPVIPKPPEPLPEPEPSETELLIQAAADAELRDLEIQQNQEILAQQMSSIELELLGGNVE